MSVVVEVYRGAGDRHGGEIREPLLGTSISAALARGKSELDANATGWERITLECRFNGAARLGDLVEVDDPVLGRPWRGRIVGLSHSEDSGVVTTAIEVRRPNGTSIY